MKIKKVTVVIIIAVLLISLISNIVIASNVTNNTTLVENKIDNEKINETENNVNNVIKEHSDKTVVNEVKDEVSNKINENTNNSSIIEENRKVENKIDDNNKVSSQIKGLLEMSNISDVSELSTMITQEKMEQIMMKLSDSNVSQNINLLSDNSGIWIEENARELFVSFINNHSSYTYSINENGYLVCDKTLRNNEKLDLAVKQETEVDIALNNVLNKDKKIIIEITNNYYEFDGENNIISYRFNENIKSKAYECEDIRIIFLNPQCYNENEIEYNLPLSDNFIKILDNIQYKVLTGEIKLTNEQTTEEQMSTYKFTDDGQVLGTAIRDQIVYHGPNNNGTYCQVGSIDQTETVALLGAEGDYFHILYAVTGTNNEKTGYVLKSNILKIGTVTDEIMTGGYRYANQSVNVQSRGLYSVAVSYGSLSNTEGATLLYDYRINYGSESYQVGFVEYWTGSGMKRGYVKMEYLSSPYPTTLVKADSKKTTYTGPNFSRFTSGTGAIGINEYVCVLGYTGDYIFIEYNTTTGRKRAFCVKSDLGISNPSSLGVTHLPDLQTNQGYLSSAKQDVSAGPGTANSLCAYVGAIGQSESVYRQSTSGINPYNQLGYTYIVYYAGSSLKGGFVPQSILTIGKNPSIPDVPSSVGQTGGFQQVYNWQTGLGGPINAYKLGNGNKRLYLVYAQHGFEDEGYGDGIEVVDIAYKFMDYMYNHRNDSNMQSILSNWTIYMVPYLNRDGITSGSSENGPGRCNVKDEIDINRNWPTVTYSSVLTKGRNYTGPTTLGTVEAQGLKNVLMNENVKPINGYNSILLDIHGWDCETIGDSAVGDYYYQQFKNDSTTSFVSHSGTHAFQSRVLNGGTASSGYFAQWAVENGINKSIILELPSHNNRITGNRSLSERFNTATINLLLGQ